MVADCTAALQDLELPLSAFLPPSLSQASRLSLSLLCAYAAHAGLRVLSPWRIFVQRDQRNMKTFVLGRLIVNELGLLYV